MKKRIVFICSIILMLSLVTAFATGVAESIYNEVISHSVLEDLSEEKISDNIEKNVALFKEADEFKVITECCDRAKYENVNAYISFISTNIFKPKEIEVINKVLNKGTTIQSLAQVYAFWLTTDEPFEIIEQVCDLEGNFMNSYWVEDAFNYVTGNEHGTLTVEEVQAYVDAGISTDVIQAANVISRKKGQNIVDILDGVKAGKSIDEYICEIYDVKALPEEEKAFDKVKLVNKAKKHKFTDAMIKSDKVKQWLEETELSYAQIVLEKANEKAEELEISLDSYNPENDYEYLKQSELPLSVINMLMDKGYTPEELLKIKDMSGETVIERAKKAREALKNE